jgi:hypothetical protein
VYPKTAQAIANRHDEAAIERQWSKLQMAAKEHPCADEGG